MFFYKKLQRGLRSVLAIGQTLNGDNQLNVFVDPEAYLPGHVGQTGNEDLSTWDHAYCDRHFKTYCHAEWYELYQCQRDCEGVLRLLHQLNQNLVRSFFLPMDLTTLVYPDWEVNTKYTYSSTSSK